MTNESYWDRRLKKAHNELKMITQGLKKHQKDPAAMKRHLKKTKKYYRSVLGEINRIDDTLYNVSETTQITEALLDEAVGDRDEEEGIDTPVGESLQT
jgi:septal ring factor EnvC (AmiA/AmiB activator)